ncbi:MAG: alpha/beta fold hydrolase [Terriglobales bacterium]
MKKLLIIVVVLLVALVLCGALVVYLRPIRVISYFNRAELARAGFRKLKVATPFGTQTAFVAGSGPTLIFLHGAGDNAGTWAKVAPHFTNRYRVVVMDLPGHGESDPVDGPLTMLDMARNIEFATAVHSPPFIIVGNSLGAWLAMIEAENAPDKTARVVVVDGGPIIGERPDLAKVPATREDARKVWDAILDPGSPRIPDFILDDVVRQAQRGPIGRLARAGDMPRFLMSVDRVQHFPVPVDLLWGESDRLVPVTYARTLQAELPAARLTTLPRCGHIPQAECPIAFTAALEKVLLQSPPASAAVRDTALQAKP